MKTDPANKWMEELARGRRKKRRKSRKPDASPALSPEKALEDFAAKARAAEAAIRGMREAISGYALEATDKKKGGEGVSLQAAFATLKPKAKENFAALSTFMKAYGSLKRAKG